MRERGRHFHGRRGGGRHFLQPALLLMVHMGPTHGYDLMERMEEIGMAPLDPSLIYRALHALEAEGLISSTWDDKETQGPPRRMYQLTQFGEEMLAQYVDDLKHSKQQIDHLLAIYDRQMNAGQEHSDSKEKG